MENDHTANVLIVDDDEIVLKLVERVLRDTDVNVHCAIDGHEAAEKLKEFDPDLVLVDFWLPDCNGIHLITELRRADQLNGARVICWSTVELQPDDVTLARELGIDVMTKDYLRDRDRLLDLMRTSASLPAAAAR